jgi:O-antigen/teichoic acid export membrane protein
MAFSSSITSLRNKLQLVKNTPAIHRFLSLLGWVSVATVVDRFCLFAGLYFCALILDAPSYGKWGIAYSAILALQVFIVLGNNTVISRYVPAQLESNFAQAADIIRMTLLTAVLIVALCTGGLAVFSKILPVQFFEQETDLVMQFLLVVWLLAVSLSLLLQAVVIAFQQGKALAQSFVVPAGLALFGLPAAAAFFGYTGMIAVAALTECTRVLFLSVPVLCKFVEEKQPLFKHVRWKTYLPMFKFGMPVFLQGVLYAPILLAAQTIILTIHPDGLTQIGIFNFCYLLFSFVLLLSTQINKAAMPVLSQYANSAERREFIRLAHGIMLTQFVGVLVIAGIVAVLAPYIMPEESSSYWPTLSLTAAAAAAVSVQTSLGNSLLIVERQVQVFYSIIPWAIIMVVMTWVLTPYGVYAILLSLLTAGVVRTLLMAFHWWRWLQSGMQLPGGVDE